MSNALPRLRGASRMLGDVLIAISLAGFGLMATDHVFVAPEELFDWEPAVLEPVPMPHVASEGNSGSLGPRAEAITPATTPTPPATDSAAPLEPVTESPGPPVTPRPLPLVADERFAPNSRGWPDNPHATAWLADGGYHLAARQPDRFVAIAVPLAQTFDDVVVTATFRKVGGPPGGGFGLIVGDQGLGPRDGPSQTGVYDVLEVGDRGEVGIWRRDQDQWVHLLPWTPSQAVHRDQSINQLEVRVTGQHLDLVVNGELVASRVDEALQPGGIGVFVGGDFNEVVLEQLIVYGNPTGAAAAPRTRPFLPITRVAIPGISVDAAAVTAKLVQRDGAATWEVPAFKIGHAQGTASAGDVGNAVLVGHVSSRAAGNVFERLDEVRVGDAVAIFSDTQRFDYVVREVRTVSRTDLSVVQSTSTRSITLVTCVGRWLPQVGDYAQRLIVRAEQP